jgi:hypothetical protein
MQSSINEDLRKYAHCETSVYRNGACDRGHGFQHVQYGARKDEKAPRGFHCAARARNAALVCASVVCAALGYKERGRSATARAVLETPQDSQSKRKQVSAWAHEAVGDGRFLKVVAPASPMAREASARRRPALTVPRAPASNARGSVTACTSRCPIRDTIPMASAISSPLQLLRPLPAGAVGGRHLHPLEGAPLPRCTSEASILGGGTLNSSQHSAPNAKIRAHALVKSCGYRDECGSCAVSWAQRSDLSAPFWKLAEHLVQLTARIAACKLGERPLLGHLLGRPHEAAPR